MFYASLASAAAFFVVPAIGSFISIQTLYMNLDATPDNARVRGVGILLLISPLLFVVVGGLTFRWGSTTAAPQPIETASTNDHCHSHKSGPRPSDGA